MPEITMYDSSLSVVPDSPNENDGEPDRALGTVFLSEVDTWIIGARWRTPTGAFPPSAALSLWTLTGDDPTANSGTRLEIQPLSFAGVTLGHWVRANWDDPFFLPSNTPRQVQVYIEGGRYVFSNPNDFATPNASPFLNNTLTVYDDTANGRWTNNPASDNTLAQNNFPGGAGYNFWVDIITDVDGGPATHSKGAEFLSFF